ncbi:hypothetical protein C6499_19115 [Candidatus Poribacteria bacterium]|nr:MAG: hypothetical protein C6499_19115 [Candidatus Poribacteria bacterium]
MLVSEAKRIGIQITQAQATVLEDSILTLEAEQVIADLNLTAPERAKLLTLAVYINMARREAEHGTEAPRRTLRIDGGFV